MLSKSRVAVLVTGALLATGGVLAQSEDAASLDQSAGYEQLSVYYPDGSGYSIIPVDIELATIEQMTATDDSMPQDLVIASNDSNFVLVTEPIVVMGVPEDVSIRPLAKDFRTIEENHQMNVEHF